MRREYIKWNVIAELFECTQFAGRPGAPRLGPASIQRCCSIGLGRAKWKFGPVSPTAMGNAAPAVVKEGWTWTDGGGPKPSTV